MTKEERREKILTEPVLPLLVKMAVPTILGMLVMTIYNLTDTFFIGRLGNKSMTAAIGISFSFVSFIQALGFWFGYGSGNTMSRRLGEKNDKEAEIISSTGIVLSLIAGIAVTVPLLVFVRQFAVFLGGNASPALLDFSTQYIRIILFSVPFSLYGTTLYNQMRLCGNVKDGMMGLLSGMILNMILDPVFIFVFKMGFIGAGWATFAGQVAGSAVLTVLASRNGNIPVSLIKARFSGNRIYHILAGGAPNFSRQGITSVAAILLNIVAARYGEETIAALTIATRIVALAYMIMIGWGQGFQPICAMNWGAKQYGRVKKALSLSAGIGTAFLVLATAVLALSAQNVSALFSKNSDVTELAAKILRLQCISLPVMGIYALCSMFMQNIGRYFSALWISVARQGIFYIPLLFALPPLFSASGLSAQTGLFCVQPTADIASFIFGLMIVAGTMKKLKSAK